jgi:hypothetical protein
MIRAEIGCDCQQAEGCERSRRDLSVATLLAQQRKERRQYVTTAINSTHHMSRKHKQRLHQSNCMEHSSS